MKNKVARLQAIREIIIHSRVKSQDENRIVSGNSS